MLFQIAEPGESVVKDACKKRVVGIDLGTTNSLVAHVADSQPQTLGDDPIVPSVVYYGGGGTPVVGREATTHADAISSVKRLIGRGKKDLAGIEKLVPYQIEGDDRAVSVKLASGRHVTPIEVSAEILRALRERAETALGGPIEGAVITVPAYFDDAQRQATRDAGRLAGLEVMRLLAEPTAAALAYGLDKATMGTYAVFDLGGGTFDVSVLKLVDGVFEVKATGGDSALGGDDLDRAIARDVLGARLDAGAGPARQAFVARAIAEARRVKEHLTDEGVGTFQVRSLEGEEIKEPFDRDRLRAVAKPFLDRCAKACRRVLKDAELETSQLDGVILVGGSTRSPVVRDFVRDTFDRDPLSDLDPDQVVALGAAVQADILAGGEHKAVLLDVVPLSLGIEMMGGVVEKLIHRNTTIPCGATQTFTTYADNQTGFDIHVLQGERETADANRSLARFLLRGVPPMVAGMGRVEITFLVDADGLLHVAAKELTTGIESAIDVKPSYGLTDEEVERMLIESFDHAEDDLAKRNLLIERVEADRILAATKGAFETDRVMLDSIEGVREAGQAAMVKLEAAMAGDDHLAIRSAVEALDIATKPFAQARMNRAIAAGFQGISLEEAEQKMGAR